MGRIYSQTYRANCMLKNNCSCGYHADETDCLLECIGGREMQFCDKAHKNSFM